MDAIYGNGWRYPAGIVLKDIETGTAADADVGRMSALLQGKCFRERRLLRIPIATTVSQEQSEETIKRL